MSLPAGFYPSDIMASVSDGSIRAHVDVDGRAIMDMNAEAPLLTWRPYECPADWLTVCAYNYSVTLFEDIWSEQTKRDWIAGNFEFIRQIGTTPAFSTVLRPSGYSVQQIIRPPQGWYAVETQTKEEMDDWIKLMPELRITYGERVGGPDYFFFVDDFITGDDELETFIGPNDGPSLVGRYGFIRQNGVITPLARAVQTDTIDTTIEATQLDYATPGQNDHGIFEDDWFVDDENRDFVDADQVEPKFIHVTLDLEYQHQNTEFSLDFIQYNKKYINPNFETTSDIGDAGNSWFIDDGFADDTFVQINDAQYLIAQRVYLYDPTVVSHVNSFGFYVGDRLGLDLRTLEMVVDLHTSAEPNDAFLDDNLYVDDFYIIETNVEHEERAYRAIEAARGLGDRVLVTFQSLRPLEAQDYITENTLVGAWVPNAL